MTAPAPGHLFLYDAALPGLRPGDYQITTSTEVAFDGEQHERPLNRHFTIEGPRFNLPPDEVAAVYPPRNGHGAFHLSLPQVVLSRRTLPWERQLDSLHLIADATPGPNDPPPLTIQAPWLALLLFEDGEDAQLLQNLPLEQIVPSDQLQRLNVPTGVRCDALDVDLALLRSVMPSKEELKLLCHVRQVNVDDRELEIGSGDGFFAVVVGNRLPSPGVKCRACLVSLEERTNLVDAVPLADTSTPPPHARDGGGEEEELPSGGMLAEDISYSPEPSRTQPTPPDRARLVLLHTWVFTSEGTSTFRDLMQNLDVAPFGTVAREPPRLTDSGHLLMTLKDRLGVDEDVLYRGPLVPTPLTRDPRGPYHSADQARLVSPESGLEDISYAAAFEVGRLLAASDVELARSILAWRRAAYSQSARLDVIALLEASARLTLTPDASARIGQALVPILGAGLSALLAKGAGPLADRHGLDAVAGAAGMTPATLAAAWSLASAADAASLLGADPGALGRPLAITVSASANTTLAAVAADSASLARLSAARARLIANAVARLKGE